MSVVYCHRNKITGKCYIGQTHKTLENRVGTKPEMSYRNNKSFSSDIVKYGWENFETTVLEVVEDSTILNDRETYWINEIKKTNEIYNKYLKGTCNYKNTPLSNNRVEDFEVSKILELFDKGYCMTDIGLELGYSINIIKGILSKNGRVSNGCGELNIVQKINKERIQDYIRARKCPLCGNPVHVEKNIHINKLVCSKACANKLLTLSNEEHKKVELEREKFVDGYKSLLEDCEKTKLKYECSRLSKYKKVRETKIVKILEDKNKKCCDKIIKNNYWHNDEEKCKQKLDLILNSGVDLMKFGYNTKLCKMLPELGKNTILFLLRKYNIPHFERKRNV